LQFGHTGTGNGILAQVPLTEAALNGLKSGSKGSGFVTTRAIAIAGALACAMLCDSVAIAADGGAAVHAPPAEAAAVASDMRVGGDDKQTRVVVDLNRKIDLAAFTLADPYRVVVDLPQVTFKVSAKAGEQSRGLVKAFRYGVIMQGGSRIVLDTKGPVRIEKAFVLDAAEGQPARLVLDLVATDRASFLRNVALENHPAHAAAAKQNETPLKADGDLRP
jgi:N-acetylmuramoyl-L-alanine amidase